MAELHLSAPERAGLLHADPHPGNFRLLPDGRLGVIDFGAVARMPQGTPEPIGRIAARALNGDADAVVEGLRAEGFVSRTESIDAPAVLAAADGSLLPRQEHVDLSAADRGSIVCGLPADRARELLGRRYPDLVC